MTRRSRNIALAALWLVTAAACARREPPKVYSLTGQVLAVQEDRRQLTVRHDDIPNFMPGMTMNFPVASPGLLTGREPGELIKATLEVTDSVGRLTAIERVGFSPLPTDTNAAAMAAGLLQAGDDAPDAAFIDQRNQRRLGAGMTDGLGGRAARNSSRTDLPSFSGEGSGLGG